MRTDILLQKRALKLIEQLRSRITDRGLCCRHRRRPQDFSREYRLTFPVLVMWLLQKSLKSLQARLHEYVRQLSLGANPESLSPGAITHARAKLSPEVFVELNRQAVLPIVYGEPSKELLEYWHGHRVLGVDSSVLRLPKNEAVAQKYGWMECSQEEVVSQRYAQGRIWKYWSLRCWMRQLILLGSLGLCTGGGGAKRLFTAGSKDAWIWKTAVA